MIEFKGIGEKICEQLVEAREVLHWADLWHMDSMQLVTTLSWSLPHAEEVVEDLALIKKDIPFDKLLRAFQIRDLGRSISQKIAQKYPGIKVLLAHDDALQWFYYFGPTTGPRVYEGLMGIIKKVWPGLKIAGFTIKSPQSLAGNAKKIVITGKLSKGRNEYEKLIEEAGHQFQKSLSKDTDILVVGENVGANKTEKATRWGTKIRDETWLTDLLDGTSGD